MRIRVRLVSAIFLAATLPLHAADIPAAIPATGPAALAAADYSEPKPAVQSFLNAVQAVDRQAIREALVTTPEQQAAIDTFLNLVFATADLQKAANARFGDQATQYFGTTSNQLESRLKNVREAQVKVTGDSALLTIPADEASKQSGGTIVLKKIGNRWKLDGATLFSLTGAPPEQTHRRMALATKLVGITQGMTQDIAAGKFASAGEAFQEFWNRSLAAAKEIDAATTAPATRPQ